MSSHYLNMYIIEISITDVFDCESYTDNYYILLGYSKILIIDTHLILHAVMFV